ncbi:MAG: MEDS domain-containing protein [Anaerolineae bacterium]|nr:MEDS domain-containing protein [Anaerolineae bacterium]
MNETMAGLVLGEHLCCIYQTEAEHRTVLTAFMRQGLEQNHKVLYIVDAHTAQTILDYLRAENLSVETLLASQQLVLIAQEDAYTRDGQFDPERMIALLRRETERALAEGYDALCVTGEMTWALRGCAGSERLIEYEHLLNDFLPGSRCVALCQYDQRCFDASVLLDVLRTHPVAVIGTALYDNFYYIPPQDLLGGTPEQAQLDHWLHTLAERKAMQDALTHQANVNAQMAELSQKLIVQTSIDEISALVLDIGRELTNSAFGYVGYIDPQTGYLVSVTMTRDIWDQCQVDDKRIVFQTFKGLWGWVLQNRQSLLTNDPAGDPRASGTPPGHLPIHRFLSAPALLDDRLIGQVALANAMRPYTPADQAFVERLAALYALALERKWVEEARITQLERELTALEQMAELPHTETTARTFGLIPLKENQPEIFDNLIDRYAVLIDQALERRVHKEATNLTIPIRTMAAHLGYLRAGPRDVIDVHVTALKRREQGINPLKTQAYVEEGRLIALELMGHLVSYYSSFAIAPRHCLANN